MSDNTPIWFLDVDGVLNAVSWSPPARCKSGKASPYLDRPETTFPINWDPDIIERINMLHDAGRVEPVWLTTWGEAANHSLRELLGINKLRCIADPPDDYAMTRGHDWWKLKEVQRVYDENPERQFVWTDDDLAIEREARVWAHGRSFLLLAPVSHRGLNHEDLTMIEDFLR